MTYCNKQLAASLGAIIAIAGTGLASVGNVLGNQAMRNGNIAAAAFGFAMFVAAEYSISRGTFVTNASAQRQPPLVTQL